MKQALFVLCIVGSIPVGAGAEGIWQWSHEASGSGTANVFDGGPPVSAEGHTVTPTDPFMSFSAVDRTQIGSFGASARAVGSSDILAATESTFRINVGFLVGYFPSGFPGGDNPGGAAEGELSSIIEFVMPGDELQWTYGVGIDSTFPFPFTGSTLVLMENVTHGQTLLELTSEVPTVETTLTGDTGDLIRITSMISGSGSMGPGSLKVYQSGLGMTFVVPEAHTVLVMGTLIILKRMRRRSTRRTHIE